MSRYLLKWYDLTEQPGGDWFVKLPLCDVYSPMIDMAFPNLNHIGWRPASKSAGYTYVKNVTKTEIKKLQAFLDLLKSTWLLRVNKSIEKYFSEELDQCFALDFNFQDASSHTYTGVGQLEYAAKYQQDKGSIDKLSELLANVCRSHPSFGAVDVMVSIPGNPSKQFHLPDELVRRMAKELKRPGGLGLRKRKQTSPLKTLPISKKLKILEGVFELDEDIDNKSVLLVDDLYQSGITMWTLAKFLKDKGASHVFGLACVKSWRDSDNV